MRTEVIFLIDKSGSMSGKETDVVHGFNSFIKDQMSELDAADTRVTVVMFNTTFTTFMEAVPLPEVKPMTLSDYSPNGMTALLDAFVTTIDTAGKRFASSSIKPEKVFFVVSTDGEENSSRMFKLSDLQERVKHQQEKYSWVFLFFGANIDAIAEASKYGISTNTAANYTLDNGGAAASYTVASAAVKGIKRGQDIDLQSVVDSVTPPVTAKTPTSAT